MEATGATGIYRVYTVRQVLWPRRSTIASPTSHDIYFIFMPIYLYYTCCIINNQSVVEVEVDVAEIYLQKAVSVCQGGQGHTRFHHCVLFLQITLGLLLVHLLINIFLHLVDLPEEATLPAFSPPQHPHQLLKHLHLLLELTYQMMTRCQSKKREPVPIRGKVALIFYLSFFKTSQN